MAKYRDFDDDYTYDDEIDLYDEPEDKYYRPPRNIRKKKKKTKKKRGKYILLGILALILVIEIPVLYAVNYVDGKMSLIQNVELDEDKIIINNDIDDDTIERLKGCENVVLLGSDCRDNTTESLMQLNKNHTDTIIICNINHDTKQVKLISVYRDALFRIPTSEPGKYIINKANYAGYKFGVESTISMLNMNMDLDIKDFIMVNWAALIDIVDAVGGVDIEISLIEQRWLNRYLVDTSVNTGVPYTEINVIPDDGTLTDEQAKLKKDKVLAHMDGIQATAFSRVRYGDGRSDYGRTERQRAVIAQIVSKAKSMNLNMLNDAVTAVCQNVATSYSSGDILSKIPILLEYELIVCDKGFPFTLTDQINSNPNWDFMSPIIPKTLEDNVAELHEVLFGVTNYVPSSTVKNISDDIITLTGVY